MEEFSEPGRPAYRILTRDHYDAMRHCRCGGRFALTATRSGDVAGRVYDLHDAECPGCGERIRYVVDVGFFVKRLAALVAALNGVAEEGGGDAAGDV